MSSSPIVVDETLVLQLDTDSESFAAGLNALTGETRWKLNRDKSAIYASPVLYRSSKSPLPQVILNSKKSLLSVDPRTEKRIGKSSRPANPFLRLPLPEIYWWHPSTR